MQAIDKNWALQLLHLRGEILNRLAAFPCGHMLDPGWSAEDIEAHLRPVVSGLSAHDEALTAAIKALNAIRDFGSSAPNKDSHEQRVLAKALSAFLVFKKKGDALCPVTLH